MPADILELDSLITQQLEFYGDEVDFPSSPVTTTLTVESEVDQTVALDSVIDQD